MPGNACQHAIESIKDYKDMIVVQSNATAAKIRGCTSLQEDGRESSWLAKRGQLRVEGDDKRESARL